MSYIPELRKVAINKEGTLGTKVTTVSTATFLLAQFPFEMKRNVSLMERDGTTGEKFGPFDVAFGPTIIGFNVVQDLYLDNRLGWFFSNVFGSDTVSTNSGQTTHAFTLRSPETDPFGLTVMADEGYSECYSYGDQVSALELTWADQATTPVQATAELIGMEKTYDTLTLGTPSFGTLNPVTFNGFACDIGDGNYTSEPGISIFGGRWRIDRGLVRKMGAGNTGISRGGKSRKVNLELDLNVWVESNHKTEFIDKYTAGTATDIVLRFRGDLISGARYYELVLTMKQARLLEPPEPTFDGEHLTATLRYRCFSDGSTDPSATLCNAYASQYNAT